LSDASNLGVFVERNLGRTRRLRALLIFLSHFPDSNVSFFADFVSCSKKLVAFAAFYVKKTGGEGEKREEKKEMSG
jgi:hypothetical protein